MCYKFSGSLDKSLRFKPQKNQHPDGYRYRRRILKFILLEVQANSIGRIHHLTPSIPIGVGTSVKKKSSGLF